MKGQITVEEWMPSACPGTKEFEEAKKTKAKSKINTIAKKQQPRINYNATQSDIANVENWYALLAAILRDWEDDLPQYNKDGSIKKNAKGEIIWEHKAHDPNYPYYASADDALAAMGIKRQYTATKPRGRRKKKDVSQEAVLEN